MSDTKDDDGCVARLEEAIVCWNMAKSTCSDELEEHLRHHVFELAKSLPYGEKSREVFNTIHDKYFEQSSASEPRRKDTYRATPSMEWLRLFWIHDTHPYNTSTSSDVYFNNLLPDDVVGTIATYLDLKSATRVFAMSSLSRCRAMKKVYFKKNINALFEGVGARFNKARRCPLIFDAFIEHNSDWRDVYERRASSYFGSGWNGALVKFTRVFHDVNILLRHDRVDVLRFFLEKGMIDANTRTDFILYFLSDKEHKSNNISTQRSKVCETTMEIFKDGRIGINKSHSNGFSSSACIGGYQSDRLLYTALKESSPETIKFLFSQGADVHETARPGKSNPERSFLAHALTDGDFPHSSLELLLSHPTLDVHYMGTTPDEEFTPLHYYYLLYRQYRDKGKLKLLLARGDLDVNTMDDNNRTPLHYAVMHYDQYKDLEDLEEELGMLLMRGDLNVNATDNQEMTPLHYAIHNLNESGEEKHETLVKLLIESGADPYFGAEGSAVSTPLSYASDALVPAIIEWLEKNDCETAR